MRKALLIFISILFVVQFTEAQKRDTVFYDIKDNGKSVIQKSSADNYRIVISPDRNIDNKLFTVKEYYLNGNIKMIGTSLTRDSDFCLQGKCLTYFPNGHKQSLCTYINGDLLGIAKSYYPNGKLYAITRYSSNTKFKLLECSDSTGKILTANGKGTWLHFDKDFTRLKEYGPVVNGRAEGKWHDLNNSTKYITIYKKNIIVKTNDPEKTVGYYIFFSSDTKAIYASYDYNYSERAFSWKYKSIENFFPKAFHYPAMAREQHIEGYVNVAFCVEKNGEVTNRVLSGSPSVYLQDEALREVKMLTWHPATHNGKPVASQVVIHIEFTWIKLPERPRTTDTQ